MSLFDVYIAVDWSAKNSPTPAEPSKDSVWFCESIADSSGSAITQQPEYFRTRSECISHVRKRLLLHAAENRRVFVGFDFAYGYPAGFSKALGYTGASPWRWTWTEISRLIQDGEDNRNNRFEVASMLNSRCGTRTPGPFWGCPTNSQTETLKSDMANQFTYPYIVSNECHLPRLRRTEQVLPGVQPTWKLFTTGSVGSQVLVGIPAVLRLRENPFLRDFSRVWPFETGFTSTPTPDKGPFVLHAEIWPGVVNHRIDPKFRIADQAQVHAYVTWLAELDSSGELGKLFQEAGDGTADGNLMCIEEEGWILGAKPKR